jgi:peroxisomal 3,2-trans-enoyl-CoA isomerase
MDFSKAKSLLESSAVSISNDTKLKLYGLYKQATDGVCSVPKPSLTDFIGRSKWTSWSSLGKMTKQDAQKQYIQVVEQLFPDVSPLEKAESKSEHIMLIKKSPLHWEMIFNRPDKYNAITLEMYKRIIEIFDEASEDEQLVLLSVTGNGKFYSSGTDLADPAKMFVCKIFLHLIFIYLFLFKGINNR